MKIHRINTFSVTVNQSAVISSPAPILLHKKNPQNIMVQADFPKLIKQHYCELWGSWLLAFLPKYFIRQNEPVFKHYVRTDLQGIVMLYS